VALDVPEAVLQHIAVWQEAAFAGLPNVRRTQCLHLTLCFLGQMPADSVPALRDVLATVPFARLRLALGNPLFLPERGKKRVIALPLLDTPAAPGDLASLIDLQRTLSESLARASLYRPERRSYLPHITVARYRRPGNRFPLQNVTFPELCPSDLVLYTSDLTRGGAVHTPLARFPAR
jgi:2'-5' RNA ligase